MPWVGLQYVIVVFPDQTYLLFNSVVIFRGSEPVVLRNPHISVIFHEGGGGVRTPCTTPAGSAHGSELWPWRTSSSNMCVTQDAHALIRHVYIYFIYIHCLMGVKHI